MEETKYVIVEKETLNIIEIKNNKTELESYSDELYYKVIMIVDKVICCDMLTVEMKDKEVVVSLDPSKYKYCRNMILIREKRDKMLSLTDWTMMSDTNLTAEVVASFREYRKKLRDLTDCEIHPNEIKIPEHAMVPFPWRTGVF
jgi:hypothetical protein